MKNITVAVQDEVYRKARIAAAERQTSLSALVANFLHELAGSERRWQRLLLEERKLRKLLPAFAASQRLPREVLHQRD